LLIIFLVYKKRKNWLVPSLGILIFFKNPIILRKISIRHLDESVFELYKSKSQIEKIIWSKFAYSFFGPLYIAKYFEKNGKIHRDFGGNIEQGNEIISQYPI